MHDFIDSSGHNPVLSEFYKFPVNPTKNTIDNCIESVKKDADIFVLIVGNRYGGLLKSGKSITNTEFLTAKSKGIPIYTFIDKKILSIISVWEKNRDGNFKDIVDSTKIFEFVSEIRNEQKLWTFEYEKAGDIISILKTQLSYLFKNSLEKSTKYDNKVDFFLEKNVTNQALNIVLEKESNDFFELDFLCQVLIDELKKIEPLKNDSKYRMLLDTKKGIHEKSEIIDWMGDQMNQILNLASSLKNLIDSALREFFGETGVPSDLKGLVYVAQTYARIYKEVLNWSINISCTNIPDEVEVLKEKLSKLNSNLIEELWDFPKNQVEYIENIKNQILNGEKPDEIKIILTVTIEEENLREFHEELEEFKTQNYNT
jgi:hypothetical protein